LDFDEDDIQGCPGEPITPGSIAMSLQDRYALGATTTLSVTGLNDGEVTSSDPEVVVVTPLDEARFTLDFVGEGKATITVAEGVESATARVEVAPLERFEVFLLGYANPPLRLAGRAVIRPSFEVQYFDRHGRLYGGGLAETSWQRIDPHSSFDAFQNLSLESGPHEVEVRVGNRLSVIEFEAVAEDEVRALWILETDVGEGRIRVDAVGITAAGTQVWNIGPYFEVDDDFFLFSFEYRYDPDARPTTVIAESIALSINGPLEPVQKTIYGTPVSEPFTITFGAAHASAAVTTPGGGGHGPLVAILSLLLITLLLRMGTRARSES
jgi:hypothetical protein